MDKIKLIAFIGSKRCGKDTAYQQMRSILQAKNIECTRLAFADKVYEEVAACLGLSVIFIRKNKAVFRTMLQWYGTEYRRHFFGDDYWLEQITPALDEAKEQGKVVCITDCRFPNEEAFIRSRGGIIVRIRRFQVGIDTHDSEINQLRMQEDTSIDNRQDIPHLREQVEELLKQCGILSFNVNDL